MLLVFRMFSGCEDAQTSADVQDVSRFGLPDATGAGGACTNAVLANIVSVCCLWLEAFIVY